VDQNFHSYWLNLYIQFVSYRWQYGHCVDGEYDTKMHLKETGQEGVGKNHLTEDGDQWWNIVNILMKNLQIF
jgi:hypothetical protein